MIRWLADYWQVASHGVMATIFAAQIVMDEDRWAPTRAMKLMYMVLASFSVFTLRSTSAEGPLALLRLLLLVAIFAAPALHGRRQQPTRTPYPPQPSEEALNDWYRWQALKDHPVDEDEVAKLDLLVASLIAAGLDPNHPHVTELRKRVAEERAYDDECRQFLASYQPPPDVLAWDAWLHPQGEKVTP